MVEWPDVPPSLNVLLNMNWRAKRKLSKAWAWVVVTMPFAERQRLLEAAKEKSRVKMLITLHNARQYDRDNAFGACKVIVDAAKNAGLIYDDRSEFLDLDVQQVKSTRKAKKTVIEMEIL